MFVLCIMILVSSDTRPFGENFAVFGTIPLCLIAVCTLTGLTLGTNPAQALAFQLAYYTFTPGTGE